MSKQNSILLLMLVCLFGGIGTVFASPGSADLEVDFRGQNSPFVYSPYTYRVRVNNVGSADAMNVNLTVDLPLTDTSPNKYVLGTISGIDTKCQLVSNKLECNLGKVKSGRGKTVKFNFEFPVSSKNLEMKGTVSTTSNEPNLTNNVGTKTPNFRYPSNNLSSADILNSHCTGTNLSSYFECALFPSSILSHSVTLEANGTITFTQQGYTGSWYQPSPNELHFEYVYGGNTVLEFNGFATNSSCFEGLTTFPNNTMYVSPYKVCVQ